MFTIEHEFDHTKITILDEGEMLSEDGPVRFDDLTIKTFEDCVELNQYDAPNDTMHRIVISLGQVRQLVAALNLPEGSYVHETE